MLFFSTYELVLGQIITRLTSCAMKRMKALAALLGEVMDCSVFTNHNFIRSRESMPSIVVGGGKAVVMTGLVDRDRKEGEPEKRVGQGLFTVWADSDPISYTHESASHKT
jgi:hypothetical protein